MIVTIVIKTIMEEKNDVEQKRFADVGRIIADDGGPDHISYCKQFLGVLDQWTRTLKLPQRSRFGMTALHMEKVIDLSDSKKTRLCFPGRT